MIRAIFKDKPLLTDCLPLLVGLGKPNSLATVNPSEEFRMLQIGLYVSYIFDLSVPRGDPSCMQIRYTRREDNISL